MSLWIVFFFLIAYYSFASQSRGMDSYIWHSFWYQFLLNLRIVESVGEDVEELKEGDSVVPIFLSDCKECVDCKSEKSNLCSKFPFEVSPLLHRDETSRFTTVEGETLHHFLYISSFSEYTVVDITNVTKIDPEIPPNRACLFSCGVSTGNFLTSSVFLSLHVLIISRVSCILYRIGISTWNHHFSSFTLLGSLGIKQVSYYLHYRCV